MSHCRGRGLEPIFLVPLPLVFRIMSCLTLDMCGSNLLTFLRHQNASCCVDICLLSSVLAFCSTSLVLFGYVGNSLQSDFVFPRPTCSSFFTPLRLWKWMLGRFVCVVVLFASGRDFVCSVLV